MKGSVMTKIENYWLDKKSQEHDVWLGFESENAKNLHDKGNPLYKVTWHEWLKESGQCQCDGCKKNKS